jgi:hypothetical protein
MSFLPGHFPAGAAAASGIPLSSVNFVAFSSSTDGATTTIPDQVKAGDLIVVAETVGYDATEVTPTGFTLIANVQSNMATVWSYKIADGTEGNTSLTGTDAAFEARIIMVFRGNVQITGVSVGSLLSSGPTGADPAGFEITSGSGLSPLIVFASFAAADGTLTGVSATAADMTLHALSYGQMYAIFKIYNSSPANISVDMADSGFQNTMVGFYLQLTGTGPVSRSRGITLVGTAKGTAASGVANNITLPGPPQAGDVVVVGACSDSGTIITVTDGTNPYNILNESGDFLPHGVWWKVMSSTPDTTVRCTGFTGTAPTAFVAAVFRGVESTLSPLDPNALTTEGNTLDDPDPGAVVALYGAVAMVSFAFLDDDNITSCTQSGATNVDFQAAGGVAGTTSSTMFGWQTVAYPDQFSGNDPAIFVTNGDDAWAAVTFALRPA